MRKHGMRCKRDLARPPCAKGAFETGEVAKSVRGRQKEERRGCSVRRISVLRHRRFRSANLALWRRAHLQILYISILRIPFMLAYPLQPCPACLQTSVRLCEGTGQISIPELQKQLSTEKECRLLGGGYLPSVKSEDKRWHPERLLLYHCTECRYARLSISGLLRRESSPTQNTAGAQRECSCRVLVLRHDVLHHDVLHQNAKPRDERELAGPYGDTCIGDSRNGDSQNGDSQAREDKVWLAPPERRLVQQSVTPAVFVSTELPEEESYAPAKWRYFVGGAEVCGEGFQKQLDRAYARCRAGSLEGRP